MMTQLQLVVTTDENGAVEDVQNFSDLDSAILSFTMNIKDRGFKFESEFLEEGVAQIGLNTISLYQIMVPVNVSVKLG